MNNLERYKEHLRRMKEDPEYRKSEQEKKEIALKEYWTNLKPFEKASDVPQLPNPLTDFYTNRIIELGGIRKSELKDGQWYYGDFRNSHFGRWNQSKQVFEYINYSFGHYWDECNHFEDDDRFALFVPLREATREEIENELNKIK